MIEPTETDNTLWCMHGAALIASDAFRMAQRFVDIGGELPEVMRGFSARAHCLWLRDELNRAETMANKSQLERQRYWRRVFGSGVQKRWFNQ